MKKRILMVFFLFALSFGSTEAQSFLHSVGIGVNAALPIDQLNTTLKTGYELGGELNLNVFQASYFLNIGASYNFLPGKTVIIEETYENYKLPDFDYYKVFVGLKFINEKGFYIKPTIHYAFDTNYRRFGAEAGVGYEFNIINSIRAGVGIKLSMINLIGNKEDEVFGKTINFGFSVIY